MARAHRGAQRKTNERLVRKAKTPSRFDYDKTKQPDDMDYNWKRQTYGGKDDRGYMIGLQENHWSPVPASRHPELSDAGGDNMIIKDGLVLMERPAYLSEEAHQEDINNARQQHGDQLRRLEQNVGQAPGVPKIPTQVSRNYERTEVPADE